LYLGGYVANVRIGGEAVFLALLAGAQHASAAKVLSLDISRSGSPISQLGRRGA